MLSNFPKSMNKQMPGLGLEPRASDSKICFPTTPLKRSCLRDVCPLLQDEGMEVLSLAKGWALACNSHLADGEGRKGGKWLIKWEQATGKGRGPKSSFHDLPSMTSAWRGGERTHSVKDGRNSWPLDSIHLVGSLHFTYINSFNHLNSPTG